MQSYEVGAAEHGGYYVVSGRQLSYSTARIGDIPVILFAGNLPDCLEWMRCRFVDAAIASPNTPSETYRRELQGRTPAGKPSVTVPFDGEVDTVE